MKSLPLRNPSQTWQTLHFFLWSALALNILRHEEMLAVVDHIAELADPVAKYDDTGFFGQLHIYLNMPMAVDEIVYVGMILNVALRVEDEMLAVFTHIGRLLAIGPLQA